MLYLPNGHAQHMTLHNAKGLAQSAKPWPWGLPEDP